MIAREPCNPDGIGPRVALLGGKEDVMKQTIDARDESRDDCREQDLTGDRFLEQFAALEDSLGLLQAHMHSMSETAKLFASLARQIRRSSCPATGHQDSSPPPRLGPPLKLTVSDHRK